MKRIIKYTFGWDLVAKKGYLTLIDESGDSHAFKDLNEKELHFLSNNLGTRIAHIDHNHWIIWEEKTKSYIQK